MPREVAMSYDYMLFRPLRSGPMSSWPAEKPESLGTESEVKARLAEVFPGLTWRAPAFRLATWDDGDHHAQFTVVPEPDGTVRFVGMTHCARGDVERLARHLGPAVVAVDPQKMTVYSTADGTWTPTR
jgi:hypothetical protein